METKQDSAGASGQAPDAIFLHVIRILLSDQQFSWMDFITDDQTRVTSVRFLQTGGKLLILYLQEGGVFTPPLFFLRLQGGEVYKRFRSQVRGSERRPRRCLRRRLR